MTLVAFLLYLLVGSMSGLLAGLLGISGGVFTVPCLFFLFRYLDFPPNYVMHMAIGTSLASMVFNALAATIAHARKKNVLWDLFKQLLPGIIIGSIIGGFTADFLSTPILETIFAIFISVLGFHFIRPFFQSPKKTVWPGKRLLGIYGAVIAFLANILGIGGGTMTVPTLLHHQIPEKKAIATAAATGLVITFFGALSYMAFGVNDVKVPLSFGYIYLPAFLIVSFSSLFTVGYGADLTDRLSPLALRRIFGSLLLIIGLLMLTT